MPMVVYMCVFGTIYIMIALRLRKLPSKTRQDIVNEFLYAIMWFVGAIFYPFSYSAAIDPFVEEAFNWFSAFAMIGVFLVVVIIVGREKVLVNRDVTLRETRNFQEFADAFDQEYSLRKDVLRKAFHAFIPSFVLAAYLLGGSLVEVLSLDFVTGHDLGIFLIINCGFGGLFLFAAADILRLSHFFEDKGLSIFHLLPSSVMNILTKRMHYKELYTFVPTVLILLSFIPFLPFPFAVFSAVTLIASISDAMASIGGKAFDKARPGKCVFPSCKYKFFKEKNIVGYIAGTASTFFIVFFMFLAFQVPGFDVIRIIITSTFTALTFFMIDILSLPINDNLLNPLVCGIIMVLFIHVF